MSPDPEDMTGRFDHQTQLARIQFVVDSRDKITDSDLLPSDLFAADVPFKITSDLFMMENMTANVTSAHGRNKSKAQLAEITDSHCAFGRRVIFYNAVHSGFRSELKFTYLQVSGVLLFKSFYTISSNLYCLLLCKLQHLLIKTTYFSRGTYITQMVQSLNRRSNTDTTI